MALDELESFLGGIRTAESGSPQGVYTARNASSGAYGAYQIMPAYWESWAAQAGIPGASMSDPAAQDRVARFKLTEYYNRFGSWDLAAVAWRAGPVIAQNILEGGWGAANSEHVSDEDLAAYIRVATTYLGDGYAPYSGPTGSPGEAQTSFGETFQPSQLLARMMDKLSQQVAGGARELASQVNTQTLAATAEEVTSVFGDAAVEAEGTESAVTGVGSSWSSGNYTHPLAGNAARLADPGYQEIAHGIVSEVKEYLSQTWGLEIGQYRDLDVLPPGGSPTSDHYWGGALDIMTSDLEVGNQIHDWLTTNSEVLGIRNILWQQPHHYDHIHVSFLPPGNGAPTHWAPDTDREPVPLPEPTEVATSGQRGVI